MLRLLARRARESTVMEHGVPEAIVFYDGRLKIEDWRLKIDRLRDREGVVERAEGIASDLQGPLRHLRAYLVRETRTEHQDTVIVPDMPRTRRNINSCLEFHFIRNA